MSTFCYRDTELNTNVNASILRALNGKDVNFSRKRKFFGEPPKPDTPPVSVIILICRIQVVSNRTISLYFQTTPYWNNPIWGGDITSPPVNVSSLP